ncbi:DUF2752 domain-containing protein [Neolewinella aurantiaca]|uniref:DUF2752 domain-containing protein n=1 Tax=Neolewinella aurantiaca TaxID=2602767 RepID=A0A5C7FJV1_9BACT|nr:DUF2752 domain-containing protein [Neolewinella aurantiaca]
MFVRILNHRPEILFWSAALLALALNSPEVKGQSLCFFRFAGLSHCPGCGLGTSISHLFRGHLAASFAAHPFGVPVSGVLLFHLITSIKQEYHAFAQSTL